MYRTWYVVYTQLATIPRNMHMATTRHTSLTHVTRMCAGVRRTKTCEGIHGQRLVYHKLTRFHTVVVGSVRGSGDKSA